MLAKPHKSLLLAKQNLSGQQRLWLAVAFGNVSLYRWHSYRIHANLLHVLRPRSAARSGSCVIYNCNLSVVKQGYNSNNQCHVNHRQMTLVCAFEYV